MDIGKAVPVWLDALVVELATCWETGYVGHRIFYEYAGSMPPHPKDEDEIEDEWNIIMFPMPERLPNKPADESFIPDAMVDVLAIKDLLDDVNFISVNVLKAEITISGKSNGALISVLVCCSPPDNVEPVDSET